MNKGIASTMWAITEVTLVFALAICAVAWSESPEGQAALEEKEQLKQEERFFWGDGNNGVADIIVDRKTGVCYLWKAAGYKGGLTVLVDAEGNPLIWEGEYENG